MYRRFIESALPDYSVSSTESQRTEYKNIGGLWRVGITEGIQDPDTRTCASPQVEMDLTRRNSGNSGDTSAVICT